MLSEPNGMVAKLYDSLIPAGEAECIKKSLRTNEVHAWRVLSQFNIPSFFLSKANNRLCRLLAPPNYSPHHEQRVNYELIALAAVRAMVCCAESQLVIESHSTIMGIRMKHANPARRIPRGSG
jgi:hypothetical protein